MRTSRWRNELPRLHMSAFSPATDRTARCARRETPSRAPEGLRGGPGTEGSCAWKSYPLVPSVASIIQFQ